MRKTIFHTRTDFSSLWIVALSLLLAGTCFQSVMQKASAQDLKQSGRFKVAQNSQSLISLSAKLQEHSKKIDKGVVWYVFKANKNQRQTPPFIGKYSRSITNVTLPLGDYLITATYGQAFLTKTINLSSPSKTEEIFVMNAGGLSIQNSFHERLKVKRTRLKIDLFSGDTDQFGNRTLLLKNISSDKTLMLNAGIYHIVSRYGAVNAIVKGDITVEAGKISTAKLSHDAAHITFKLVRHENGEALPDTQWELISSVGEVLKTAQGALPNMVLKSGDYSIKATRNQTIFEKKFSVASGQTTFIEVLAEEAQ